MDNRGWTSLRKDFKGRGAAGGNGCGVLWDMVESLGVQLPNHAVLYALLLSEKRGIKEPFFVGAQRIEQKRQERFKNALNVRNLLQSKMETRERERERERKRAWWGGRGHKEST